MAKYNYGNAIERYPIKEDETWALKNGEGILKVHDIYNDLPDFMREADLIFSDFPYNRQMVSSYYTKADKKGQHQKTFETFVDRAFELFDEVNPKTLYIEIGKQNLELLEEQMRQRFYNVQVFATYYKRYSPCYIIRGSHEGLMDYDFNGLDELDVIRLLVEMEDYECIGDIFMGQGAVAENAYRSRKKFVGTELNPKRLAVALEKVAKLGGEWHKWSES